MTRPNVSYGNRETAMANEVLRTTVGSGVHGIAIAGTDDHDEMGIFIEPKGNVYGTDGPMSHYISRTQPEGVRSGPGDTDLVMYSLRRYIALAAKGNPTALLPLYAPDNDVLVVTDTGRDLRAHRSLILSQEAVHRFLGYMHAQHERMLGCGKRNRVPNRPELIEKYGWDVKYGSHALRLALQGYELARHGTLTLPMEPRLRADVLAVKRGEIPRDVVSEQIERWTSMIRNLLQTDSTPLPPQPDWAAISRWSIEAHETHWNKK